MMGRELRQVPKDWKHPRDEWKGEYKPLLTDYPGNLEEFRVDIEEMGLGEALDYYGGGPQTDDYMPVWTLDEATWFMMYETTSEGTPLSPSFETIEELAHWLADNNASAFGKIGATYEQWLSTCKAGFAPSGLITSSGIISGVEAMHNIKRQKDIDAAVEEKVE